MKRLPLVESIAWIVGTTLMFTGGTFYAAKNILRYRQIRRSDPNYFLSRIIQTGPQKEALSTLYLAELMQISADRPTSVGYFDPRVAELRLLSSPVIRQAQVKLVGTDTIYIDYAVRQPIAWLAEFQNTALDSEGVPFPAFPFFTPKNLPQVVLGVEQIEWGKPIQSRKMEMALALVQQIHSSQIPILRLDVSKMDAPTLGSREIVLVTHDQGIRRFLRLTVKNYAQELGNYLELKGKLPPKPQVIDLRIPKLGYIHDANPVDSSKS